jgi:hypothetical protein
MFCIKCGTQLADGANFCVKCGTPVQTDTASTSSKKSSTSSTTLTQIKKRLKNHDLYEGEAIDNIPNGKGKLTCEDGNIYEGDFVDGVPHGKGKLTEVNNGEVSGVSEGDFVKGSQTGRGKYTCINVFVYEGDFKYGYFSGKGKITYDNGNVYEGDFYAIGDRGPAGGIIFYDYYMCHFEGDLLYLEAAPDDYEKVTWENAKQFCREYSMNGYDDWSLPSKDELNLMYKCLKESWNKGKFSKNKYWSSSHNKDKAFYQSFIDGEQGSASKSCQYSVRPIRTFDPRDEDATENFSKEKLTFYNGVYEGQTMGSIPYGEGKMIYFDGRVYEGLFINSEHVFGKRTYPDGKVVEGKWKNDEFVG